MEIMPMMPYEFQEVEWRALEGIIEECLKPNSFKAFNYVAEKSRDMTWSWTMCMLSLHRWQFRNSSILIGSRKEDEVDTSGDMDTPFEKIRFQLLRQPDFLVPRGFDWRKHSKHMHLINPNGGEITGESANPNFGRGGRKLFVWFDEFAFWDHDYAAWRSCSQTTNLRIAVSTPNGPNNKFARLRHGEEQENVIVRTSPWYLHPLKSQGLEMWNGKYTSPWYREQKSRMSAEDMAREIDISYASSKDGCLITMEPPTELTNLNPYQTKQSLWHLILGFTSERLLVRLITITASYSSKSLRGRTHTSRKLRKILKSTSGQNLTVSQLSGLVILQELTDWLQDKRCQSIPNLILSMELKLPGNIFQKLLQLTECLSESRESKTRCLISLAPLMDLAFSLITRTVLC